MGPAAHALVQNLVQPKLTGNGEEFAEKFDEYLRGIAVTVGRNLEEGPKLQMLVSCLGEIDNREFRNAERKGKKFTYPMLRAFLMQRYGKEPHVSAREKIRLLRLKNKGKLTREAWRDLTSQFSQLWYEVPDPSEEEARDWTMSRIPENLRYRIIIDEIKRGDRTFLHWVGGPEYLTLKHLRTALRKALDKKCP